MLPINLLADETRAFHKLDEIDLAIIDLLCEEGRMSGRDMAQRTNLSEANVSRRLARMVDEGSVRMIGLIPPALVGLQVQAYILIRCQSNPAAVAECLAKIPGVHWCCTTFGRFDLVMFVVTRDEQTLLNTIDQMYAIEHHLEEVLPCPVLEYYTSKGPNESIGGLTAQKLIAVPQQYELDEVDRALIRTLQKNGRASFAELSAAADISATSAADRFRRLHSDNVVQIITLPNQERIGKMIRVSITIRMKGPIRPVLQAVASMPGAIWTAATAGPYGVICDFACADEVAMNELRGKLLALPSVRSVSLSLHRQVFKDDFVWCDTSEPATKD